MIIQVDLDLDLESGTRMHILAFGERREKGCVAGVFFFSLAPSGWRLWGLARYHSFGPYCASFEFSNQSKGVE